MIVEPFEEALDIRGERRIASHAAASGGPRARSSSPGSVGHVQRAADARGDRQLIGERVVEGVDRLDAQALRRPSRSQPRAAPCARAAAAVRAAAARPDRRGRSAPRSARVTRARISAAALRVKVMARICAGSSTVHKSRRKRCVSTAVLPEPAGASSSTEPAGSLAPRAPRHP